MKRDPPNGYVFVLETHDLEVEVLTFSTVSSQGCRRSHTGWPRRAGGERIGTDTDQEK